METISNIKKVSFWFFASVGFIYIFSGLMQAVQYETPVSGLIHKTTRLPFIFLFLCYTGSLIIESEENKPLFRNIVLGLFSVIFIAILVIDFILPDLN